MYTSVSLVALAASISAVAATTQGFNYGAVTRTGTVKVQSDFEAEFKAAKGLANTNGAFSSARLYTTIQGGTTNSPISAIPAAIASDTKLMLGMWASSGSVIIDNEIAALQSAIKQYGSEFTNRVNGISVGSEDLYRITPTGLMNDPLSVGAGPAEVASYIKKVRTALSGTALAKTPIGHVDTWTAWQNGSNSAVIEASDFLGMNTFPYFQTTESNGIDNGASLFDAALAVTKSAAGNKKVIITETGWPVGGKDSAQAKASVKNAKTYWDQVGCKLFGTTDVYWYTLVDANTDIASQPQFGVVGTTLNTSPLFDLTCPIPSTSTSTSSSATSTSSGAQSSSTVITVQTSTDASGAVVTSTATSVSVAKPTGTTVNAPTGGSSTTNSPAGTSTTSAPTNLPNSSASTSRVSTAFAGVVAMAAFMALA